ncbi:YcjF family protein [Dolosicoccus paucivorans]|uniref:DUF697 domain-containing protein n=1 Tax=Dolosicoccus paucivorans TaxID=84521 RepID=A0A1G8LFQ5_9LACT|nr:GTPase [Dolosicoccus paucivorans]PMB84814.1 DUF697 domain-containing protein [Dolosicoccus paucivorans]PMC58544.1 DUF697 domain-containing protein [Dolosicoccus paucivorans]SDI54498.1 small GTP-binding protein domain-containing protein [Dolosicoccus paucivorans]
MSIWNKLISKRVDKGLADDLLKKTQQEVDKMPPTNIIVAGKTGSGKSTLINALFREKIAETGVGAPVTQHIEKITKKGMPITLYDTKGLELTSKAQHEVLTSISDLIKDNKGTKDAIHLVYYTLNANMRRIEPYEEELISAIAKQVPVILVLTQAIGQEYYHFEEYLQKQNLPIKAIVPVLAKPYVLSEENVIPAFGLQGLIDITMAVLPQEAHASFINAQQVDLERKVTSARSWAKKYITTAFGVGFTPIPVADAAVLVPMQIGMLAHITSIFGLGLDKAQIVSLLAGIGGTSGATMLGKYIVSSAFKFFPGIGSVAGGAISGITAGSLTIALAYSYIEVLKQLARAEMMGRNIPLAELQTLMNKNFSDQLKEVNKFLPEKVKKEVLPEWLNSFLK